MWKLILLDMAVSPEYMTNMAAWDNFKGSPTHPRLEAMSKTFFSHYDAFYLSQSKNVNKRKKKVLPQFQIFPTPDVKA